MTRDEAVTTVKGLFRALDAGDSPGLNEYGLGGAAIHGARVSFAYDKSAGTLASTALIYQFPRPLSDDRRVRIEAAGRPLLSQGMNLHYDPESRYLSLQRVYASPVSADQFVSDVEKLSEASVQWDLDVLDRVLETAGRQ